MEEKKTYRLEEMLDSMEKSLDNIKLIIKQQTRLIEIVKEAPDAENFKEFIEESEKQIETLKKQKVTLKCRKIKLAAVLKAIKNSEDTEKVFNEFMDAIGMFEN